MQDKLDREATALKEQMSTENEKRMNESKALQDKLEKEKEALATQMQSGSKELEEKMAREEELRRQEAEAMKVTSRYSNPVSGLAKQSYISLQSIKNSREIAAV